MEKPKMRCHYEVMELPRDASMEEIKKQYKKLALKWHPDRNFGQEEIVTQKFKEITTAYSVLSDPQEKEWYDTHREQILRGGDGTAHGEDDEEDDYIINIFNYFNSSCYDDMDDTETGFFTVYRELFERLSEQEDNYKSTSSGKTYKESASSFGSSQSNDEEVINFYNYWENFVSGMTFAWHDKYNLLEAPNRQVKRLMEKDNLKLRDQARKEYNASIRSLVKFVKKRDIRYIRIQEEKAQRKKLEEEEKTRRQEEEKQRKLLLREKMRQDAMNHQMSEEEIQRRKDERQRAFLLADNDSDESDDEQNSKKNKKKRNKKKKNKLNGSEQQYLYDVEDEEEELQKRLQDLDINGNVESNDQKADNVIEEELNGEDNKDENAEEDGSVNEIEIFECKVCEKKFKSEMQLEQHLNSKVHRKRMQDIAKSSGKKK